VLAALGLRWWFGEGFKKVVVACHSEYVINGISSWILTWRKDEWRTNTGAVVENLDLWRKLDAKLRDMEKHEMLVQFWRIPQGLNEADVYATAGAVSLLYYLKFMNSCSRFTVCYQENDRDVGGIRDIMIIG